MFCCFHNFPIYICISPKESFTMLHIAESQHVLFSASNCMLQRYVSYKRESVFSVLTILIQFFMTILIRKRLVGYLSNSPLVAAVDVLPILEYCVLLIWIYQISGQVSRNTVHRKGCMYNYRHWTFWFATRKLPRCLHMLCIFGLL